MQPKLGLVLLLSSQCYGALINSAQLLLNPDPFDAITEALKKAGIISDVVDDFTPKCFVSAFYDKVAVEYGTHIQPSQTQDPPDLQINCPSIHDTPGMTVILTDPDAPSRENPKWSEMCHWVAVVPTSISASSSRFLSHSLAIDVDELVEYKPPGPPEKTGYHRYVFLLLEGDNSNLTKPEDRQHWGFGEKGYGRDWAKHEGLEVVGANFFFEKNKKQ